MTLKAMEKKSRRGTLKNLRKTSDSFKNRKGSLVMKKILFDLQLFAEDAPTTIGADGAADTPEKPTTQTKEPDEPKAVPKYTDDDVDRLIERKFAEWQKKQEKKTTEAERLGRMTAEEKANERIKAMEDKLREYETNAARTEMTKQARAILQDKGINVGDALLSNLIADDADATKASVEAFVSLFQSAVEKAVKDAVKGETPKTGSGNTGITKEQIMAVTNRAERQRLISENMHLFNGK